MESAENQEYPLSDLSDQDSADSTDSTLSRTETIALLNDSIDRLEQTIKSISKSSAPIPSSDSINTLLTTTQELAEAVTSDSNSASEKEETSAPEAQTTSEPTLANPTATSEESDLKTKPQETAPQATKVKPQGNLPWIISGVIAIAIAIVAIFWFGLPKQAANLISSDLSIPEVAINSDFPESPAAQEPLAPSSIKEPTVSDNLPTPDSSTDLESGNSNLEEPAEVIIPANLESPGRAKNLKLVTLEPELNLTPEQTLIVAVKSKISKLTQDYPTELINSAKINLPQNRLLVKVTDQWYELDESRQNKVANEMLKRSRQLSFNKLELMDNTGTLVARNPVIGEKIIILESGK